MVAMVCEVTVVTVACGDFVGCVVMVSAFGWVITAVVRWLVDVFVIETVAVVVRVTVVGGATDELIRGDDVIVAKVVGKTVLDSSLVDTVEIVEEPSS